MIPEGDSGHRWSGWPGAWCLDCGQPDLNEQALADYDNMDEAAFLRFLEEDMNGPCPEPGSRRHDPYA